MYLGTTLQCVEFTDLTLHGPRSKKMRRFDKCIAQQFMFENVTQFFQQVCSKLRNTYLSNGAILDINFN